MSDHQHYTGCHLHHFVCAQERIRELERKVAALSGFRRDRLDVVGPKGVLTCTPIKGIQYVWPVADAVFTPFTPPLPPPCHDRLPGATWTHPIADEPPVVIHPE